MSEHYLNIKSALGIDNVSDLAAVSVQRKNGIYLYEIDNIDIDDNGKMHRRDGYGVSIYSGSRIRSMWANSRICLFADGTNFLRLNSDDTTTILIEDINPTDPMCYVEHGERVYFSNDSIIGYIDLATKLPYPFSTPDQTYKRKMVGGHILEWFNSRLYAAHDKNLFFSDATIPTQMDSRRNAIAFPSRITMVKAVNSGLYVSDSERVYFEGGRSPTEFVEIGKLDFPAIEGMSITVTFQGAPVKKVAYWMTKNGVYAGYEDGSVAPQQGGLFKVDDGLESGVAVIRDVGYQQVIFIGKYKAGEGGASGSFKVSGPTASATSSTSA